MMACEFSGGKWPWDDTMHIHSEGWRLLLQNDPQAHCKIASATSVQESDKNISVQATTWCPNMGIWESSNLVDLEGGLLIQGWHSTCIDMHVHVKKEYHVRKYLIVFICITISTCVCVRVWLSVCVWYLWFIWPHWVWNCSELIWRYLKQQVYVWGCVGRFCVPHQIQMAQNPFK